GFSGALPADALDGAPVEDGTAPAGLTGSDDLMGSDGLTVSDGLGPEPTGGTGLPLVPGLGGTPAEALDDAPVVGDDGAAPAGLPGSDGLLGSEGLPGSEGLLSSEGLAPTGGTTLLPVGPGLRGSAGRASWGRPEVPGVPLPEDGPPPDKALLPVGPGFAGSDLLNSGLPEGGTVPGLVEAGDAPLSAGFGPSLGEFTGVRSLGHLRGTALP
ncbi:MAG: hypothetical protein WAP03_05285, partial [Methylorubrum rhodinum]